MVPKLYSFYGSPEARAVLATAKALNITLEHKYLDYRKKEHLSPEYIKLNPQHTAPTLNDNGIIIWDSHAISAYLVEKYGHNDEFYPKEHYKRALVNQRLHFNSGILSPFLETVDLAYIKRQIKEVPANLVKEIKDAYDFLEKFLEGRQWVAGDNVTIADFNLVTTVTCLDYHVKVNPELHLNVTTWIKRAQALSCFDADHDMLKHFVDVFDKLKTF